MRLVAATSLVFTALSGCAAPAAKSGDGAMLDCDASGAQSFVGQRKSDALGKDAMKRTGTSTIRWITPGQPVTMDYRTDRLNIEVDAQEIAIRITCG